MMDDLDQRDSVVAKALTQVLGRLPVDRVEPVREPESIASRRRRRGEQRPSQLATVSLVRSDDVLRWTYDRPPSRVGPRRRSVRAARMVSATPVAEFSFQEIPPNLIVQKLIELDNNLTPNQGLRRWAGGRLSKVEGPLPKGRALLFLHGTFSKSEALFDELNASPAGTALLADAAKQYKHILAFDHPTLAVSPILNACDLQGALAGFEGRIDVICHSRGGLVAAWWLRIGARNVERVVCVASPLEGTSLAAPARIKVMLDYFSNVAGAIGTGTNVVGSFIPPVAPLMQIAAGLMAVIGGMLSAGARSPLVDAGVAIVPGLVAQSRVANNQELFRLQRDQWPSQPDIYAVRSDFEPGDPDAPAWQFWKRWNRPLLTIADSVADRIFLGANDLVVDNETMVRAVQPLRSDHIYSFSTNNRVHHCNYFAQPETARRIRTWLGI